MYKQSDFWVLPRQQDQVTAVLMEQRLSGGSDFLSFFVSSGLCSRHKQGMEQSQICPRQMQPRGWEELTTADLEAVTNNTIMLLWGGTWTNYDRSQKPGWEKGRCLMGRGMKSAKKLAGLHWVFAGMSSPSTALHAPLGSLNTFLHLTVCLYYSVWF